MMVHKEVLIDKQDPDFPLKMNLKALDLASPYLEDSLIRRGRRSYLRILRIRRTLRIRQIYWIVISGIERTTIRW